MALSVWPWAIDSTVSKYYENLMVSLFHRKPGCAPVVRQAGVI
jgi:hypothetical protein